MDCLPGCDKAYLVSTGPDFGTRESRHVNAVYQLTWEDVTEGRRMPPGGPYWTPEQLNLLEVRPSSRMLRRSISPNSSVFGPSRAGRTNQHHHGAETNVSAM